MTCIIIASWMLAVVGVATTISSLWYIKNNFNTNVVWMILLSCLGVAAGIVVFAIGIAPYIPDITLPCIQIIP